MEDICWSYIDSLISICALRIRPNVLFILIAVGFILTLLTIILTYVWRTVLYDCAHSMDLFIYIRYLRLQHRHNFSVATSHDLIFRS